MGVAEEQRRAEKSRLKSFAIDKQDDRRRPAEMRKCVAWEIRG